MYLNLVRSWFTGTAYKVVTGTWLRSPMTWVIFVLLVLVGTGVAIREKGRGHLSKLKSKLGDVPAPAAVQTPQPGGQAPIILRRAEQTGGILPEFLSATLLPGRGMNVLQITAFLPGKGEVSLLASPSLVDAATAMSGIDADVNGEASLSTGGAIEVPWANQISGAILPGGMAVLSNWHGRGLTLPVNWMEGSTAGAQASMGGLLLKRPADAVDSHATADGNVGEATFNAGSFEGHWPSSTEVKTTVLLRAHALEITVVAHNVGSEPEPMGIGWRPRFSIPSGNRAQATLRLPSNTLVEEGKNGLPTGALLSVEGKANDFSSHGGAVLPSAGLNETYVHLNAGTLSSGPEVELRDPASDFGLRLTSVSPNIRALHVSSPANASFVSIDPQTNYDDPFGREWERDEVTGVVILQPGESLQWKVRLELFQPSSLTSTRQAGSN